MDAREFEARFVDEARELVVRISWCWTKQSGPFPEEDGLCHARARFDQAIDVQTGELIGKGLFNWLEWLAPKRRIGFPYRYAFEAGHAYRLLVRPAREEGDGQSRSYYVEQLLEADVREPRLDPYLQFASGFAENELERWLLVEDDAFGWANVFGYRRAGVRYLALAEREDDEPKPCTGTLLWMEEARGSELKTRFGKLAVWRVRVRESKEGDERLMLVKAVRKVRDARFDALREAYLQPVVLESSLGTFVLDRHYDWYEGTVDYLGEPCNVLLNVEEGSEDASVALARLEELWADVAGVDRRVREYAARELLENAVDWCEEELTREEFMARMSSPSVSVDPDGAVEFAFDDGDMFAGHVIMVYLDPDGTFSDVNIAG